RLGPGHPPPYRAQRSPLAEGDGPFLYTLPERTNTSIINHKHNDLTSECAYRVIPDQKVRSLKILAGVQAIIGGLIAVAIFAMYGVSAPLLARTGGSLTAAILGTAGVVY